MKVKNIDTTQKLIETKDYNRLMFLYSLALLKVKTLFLTCRKKAALYHVIINGNR